LPKKVESECGDEDEDGELGGDQVGDWVEDRSELWLRWKERKISISAIAKII